MPSRQHYSHTFLKNLGEIELGQLAERCRKWGMNPHDFAARLDRWFDNFDEPTDYPLALQLVLAVQYHSDADFKELLLSRQKAVQRHLHQRQLDSSRIYFAVPDDLADSATRHAHPLAKVWKLPNEHFFAFQQLQGAALQKLGAQDSLVLFNDTYGSGKQFMREVWPHVAPLLDTVGAVFIVGAVIAEEALALFQQQAKHGNKAALIVPIAPSQGIKKTHGFTAAQVGRLEELGRLIYPKYPLGFGDCGLLLAYQFQCPNNSLPLIWANGENNAVNGRAYPWTALFAYEAKTKLSEVPLEALPVVPASTPAPEIRATPAPVSAPPPPAPSARIVQVVEHKRFNLETPAPALPSPPAWATAHGKDEFGIWAEFCIGQVVQRMRLIPAGEFLMGSPDSEAERDEDEGPQHTVRISQDFWLADTACTQALWQVVMQNNPSYFNEVRGGGPQHPVEKVRWRDVQEFLAKLQLPGALAALPTEAEWEYACRAGTCTPFSFGEVISSEQVNFDGSPWFGKVKESEFRERTVAVKELPANPWGLFAMHGNLWEWCADTKRKYTQQTQIDPGLPQAYSAQEVASDSYGVLRGGSWFDDAQRARSAYRDQDRRVRRDFSTGIRLLLRSSSLASK